MPKYVTVEEMQEFLGARFPMEGYTGNLPSPSTPPIPVGEWEGLQLSITLLTSFLDQAESQVELDLLQTYEYPLQLEDGDTEFINFPSVTSNYIKKMVIHNCAGLVLNGFSTSQNDNWKYMADTMFKIYIEAKEYIIGHSYETLKATLPLLKLNAKGRVTFTNKPQIVTVSTSTSKAGIFDYVKGNIPNPSKKTWI